MSIREQDIESMKPINRASAIVREKTPFIRSTPTMVFKTDRHLRFSTAAGKYCKMYAGKFVQFFNFPEGSNRWFFIVNDDPTGWCVTADGRDRSAASVAASVVAGLMRDTTKAKKGDKFHLQKTGSQYKGFDLFEILMDKPMNKIGK